MQKLKLKPNHNPEPVEPHEVVVTQGACLATRPATPVQSDSPEWRAFFHATVCKKLTDLDKCQRQRRRIYGQEIADEYLMDHTPPDVLYGIEANPKMPPPGLDTPSSAGSTPSCPSSSSAGSTPSCPSSSAASNRPGPGDPSDAPPSPPPPSNPAGNA